MQEKDSWWATMIGTAESIGKCYVYRYQFLDDLSFVRKPQEVVEEWRRFSPFLQVDDLDELLTAVREKLLKEVHMIIYSGDFPFQGNSQQWFHRNLAH